MSKIGHIRSFIAGSVTCSLIMTGYAVKKENDIKKLYDAPNKS